VLPVETTGEVRYEDVTAEEITAIKSAMVSGSSGIATHSGQLREWAPGEFRHILTTFLIPSNSGPVRNW
jgi:hypothetical protein